MSETSATEIIIKFFKKINAIPRCSKHEEKIANYLVSWAKNNKLETKKDSANNVVITIPATKGYEHSESIAIQGHMDMVCEKTTHSRHNFSQDPITVYIEGDWAKAKDTTLGADDGIAIAIGLAIASDTNLKHPEIELLFTTDEETGLNGAKKLQPGFFKSNKLINIDSEREGVFTIGCAGGEDTDIALPLEHKTQDGYFYAITIDGLLGGHSGTEINKNRANAIKLMIDFFDALQDESIELHTIQGGSARNAIPKNSYAIIRLKKEIKPEYVGAFYKHILERYPEEKNIKIDLKQLESQKTTIANSKKIISLLHELPHGVYEMMNEKTVKISNNLAKIQIQNNAVRIYTNQRSLTESGLKLITNKIESIAQKYGAEYKSYNKYPSWQPNHNSKIVIKSIEIYERLFGKKPVVDVIHAGLECGIIGSKNKNMEMISIGPTMKDVHTPNEKLYIPSLEKIWQLIVNMLQEI